MFFAIITLLTALALAGVAAAFAVFGIVAIFSGLPIHAMIMGIVIELGKIVGVSWVYRHWEQRTILKYLMIPFIIMAMTLTSLGIFGLLSRAYIEQSTALDTNTVMIQRLDERIDRERRVIADAQLLVDQLDQTVNALIQFNRISGPDGARAVRASQGAQRDELSEVITLGNQRLDQMLDERAAASIAIQNMEREVGPVMFIAQLIYSDEIDIDQAVRWVIIAFIFVFDPMAIMLLMAANHSLMARGIYLEREPSEGTVPQSTPPAPLQETTHEQQELLATETSVEPAVAQKAPQTQPQSPRSESAASDTAQFIDVEPAPDESPEHFVARLLDKHTDPYDWRLAHDGVLMSQQGVIARGISREDGLELIKLARWLREQEQYEDVKLGQVGKDHGIILRRLKKETQ